MQTKKEFQNLDDFVIAVIYFLTQKYFQKWIFISRQKSWLSENEFMIENGKGYKNAIFVFPNSNRAYQFYRILFDQEWISPSLKYIEGEERVLLKIRVNWQESLPFDLALFEEFKNSKEVDVEELKPLPVPEVGKEKTEVSQEVQNFILSTKGLGLSAHPEQIKVMKDAIEILKKFGIKRGTTVSRVNGVADFHNEDFHSHKVLTEHTFGRFTFDDLTNIERAKNILQERGFFVQKSTPAELRIFFSKSEFEKATT